jgi:hypothetical protein
MNKQTHTLQVVTTTGTSTGIAGVLPNHTTTPFINPLSVPASGIPYTSYIYPTLHCDRLEITGLGSVNDMLKCLQYLIPPAQLDLQNPTVAAALADWVAGLAELKRLHGVLTTVAALTQKVPDNE